MENQQQQEPSAGTAAPQESGSMEVDPSASAAPESSNAAAEQPTSSTPGAEVTPSSSEPSSVITPVPLTTTSNEPSPAPAPASVPAPGPTEPSELELLQAEWVKKEVEYEQTISDALTKVSQTQRALKASNDKAAKAEQEKAAYVASLEHLQTVQADLQSKLSASESKSSFQATQLSTSEAEKRTLLDQVSSLREETNGQRQEVKSSKDKALDAQRRVVEIEGELSRIKMYMNNSKFKVEALQLNLELAQKDNVSLTESLTKGSADYSKYRSTSQSAYQTLSSDLDSTKSQLLTAQASLRHLTESNTSQTDRLAEALSQISSLTQQVAEQKSSFRSEMVIQQRLLDGAEKRAEEARVRVEQLENENEDQVSKLVAREEREREGREREQAAREEAEKSNVELRETIDRLVEATGGGADRSSDLLATMSPAGNLANQLRKSGKSISDVYVESVKLKTMLQKSEEERRRLDDTLSEILRDIGERAPLLKIQHQRFEELQHEANELVKDLSQVKAEKEQFISNVQLLENDLKSAKTKETLLLTHLSDLSLQVRTLSREIAIREDPSVLDRSEMEGVNFSISSDDLKYENLQPDEVISHHLITFKSIDELQAKNFQLVKAVRGLFELNKELEKENASKGGLPSNTSLTNEEQVTVEAATEMLAQMKDKLEAKQILVEKFSRERDLFSRLLAQAGISPNINGAIGGFDYDVADNSILSVVKANLESYREEIGLDAKRLREQLSDAQKELGSANVQLARVTAESQYLNERIKNLTDAATIQVNNFTGLQTQNQTLKNDITRLQIEKQNAIDAKIDAEGVVERIRVEAATLRAEKELWKSLEARLQSDIDALAKERTSAQVMFENLKNIESETSKAAQEGKERSEKLITSLESERTKLRDEVNRLKTANITATADLTEANAQLKEQMEDLQIQVNRIPAKDSAISKYQAQHAEFKEKYKQVNDALKDLRETNRILESTKTQLTAQLAASVEKATSVQVELDAAKAVSGGDSTEVTKLKAEIAVLEEKAKVAGDVTGLNTQIARLNAIQNHSIVQQNKMRGQLNEKDLEIKAKNEALQAAQTALATAEAAATTSTSNSSDASKEQLAALETEWKMKLEKAVADARAEIPPSSTSEVTTTVVPDQAVIEEAVKKAVTAKEAEIAAEKEKLQSELKTAQEQLVNASSVTPVAIGGDDTAIAALNAEKAALVAELRAAKEAAASVETLKAEVERQKTASKNAFAGQNALRGQAADKDSEIKTLKAQLEAAKTAPPSAASTIDKISTEAAVKAAVAEVKEESQRKLSEALATREIEFKALLEKSIAEAIANASSSNLSDGAPTSNASVAEIEEAVKKAVAEREAALTAEHQAAVINATAALKASERAAVEKENALKLNMWKSKADKALKENKELKDKLAAAPALNTAPSPKPVAAASPSVPSTSTTMAVDAVASPVATPLSISGSARRGSTSSLMSATSTPGPTTRAQKATAAPASPEVGTTSPSIATGTRGGRGGRGSGRGKGGAAAPTGSARGGRAGAPSLGIKGSARNTLSGALAAVAADAANPTTGIKRGREDDGTPPAPTSAAAAAGSPSGSLASRVGAIKRPKRGEGGGNAGEGASGA